ncbi:MAG: hypothetical protein CMO35_08735 [Verrucomicrobiaceae bacterium]|nr:hypothetical protein [Verrucomicrobiaceae bacterium]
MLLHLMALLLLVLAAVPASRAEERILSWHSDIVVEKSGDLVVTETITVRAEGDRIKRGIYRDLPVLREGKGGLRTTKRFTILSVKRDGKRENYKRERIENGLRIRIGNKDRNLLKGEIYTYEITYRTGRQLYLEEGRESLYWNVNGTEWEFPADEVSATVRLPEGIKGTRVWGYTGRRGTQGEDYRAALTEAGANIEATRPFRTRENLTVMLEWPPGLLDRRAYEDERVLSFDSLIKVEKNGDLLVTERIEVRFEGKFTRPFSRQEDVRWGLKRKRPLELLELKLNGKEDDYSQKADWKDWAGTGQVVEWGVHTVEITYRTGRQLLLLKDREVLRWNLNPSLEWRGHDWGGRFPVDKVSATVELPEGIQGTLGRVPAEMQAEVTPTGAKFETRGPTLTLELQWPPGRLAPIAYEEDSFLEAHPWVVFSLVLFAGALLYYLLAWAAVGRDPKKGVIIPQFAPPAGYSPGAVRYLDRMKYDETCMAAGLLGLAAKGVVTIKKSGGTYTVRMRSKPPPLPSGGPPPLPSTLAPEERTLRDKLVGGGKIALKNENWKKIRQARRNHEHFISRKLRKTHFLRNMGWWFPGLFLTLVGMVVLYPAIGALGSMILTGVVFLGVGGWWAPVAVWKAFASWSSGNKATAIILAAVGLPICAFGLLALVSLTRGSGAWATMGFLYPALLNLIFYHLIKAPTPLGRKVLDHVEGFRHYLSVAEEERLNLENPPEKTPELFEQFLPYALALGCEQQWSQKFDSVLRAAGQSPGSSGWTPSYYTGSVSGLGSSFASSIGSSLSSSLAASSSSPYSSGGGGGGGGSSGGGGGGGGGGGW